MMKCITGESNAQGNMAHSYFLPAQHLLSVCNQCLTYTIVFFLSGQVNVIFLFLFVHATGPIKRQLFAGSVGGNFGIGATWTTTGSIQPSTVQT